MFIADDAPQPPASSVRSGMICLALLVHVRAFMPLLTELGCILGSAGYKHVAPTGA